MGKTIIIGAGLGGLTTGILLKKAQPNEEVVIYDGNRHAGGFCNAFQKATTHDGEKIVYTINIPLITGDFSKGAPFDDFMKYMGVKNIDWKIVNNFFMYYPENEPPFAFTKNGANELPKIAKDPKEQKNLEKFFKKISKFYNDLFNKANLPPKPLQAIKMMFTMPGTLFTMLNDKPYLEAIKKIGIKTKTIQEIVCVPEAFMGVDVDKVSAMGEMCMIQSFLQTNSVQPAPGNTFQDLANNFSARFAELGGKLELNTKIDSIVFDKKEAVGVRIGDNVINADNVIISVAQDRIKPLLMEGTHISSVKKLTNKINKLTSPNSDYYCYFLIDKETVEQNPKLTDFAYHIYKLPEGRDATNWKLALWVPNKCYNDKYYILECVMTETSQDKINWWHELRASDYQKYTEEKEKMVAHYLELIQEVEPIFKEHPPIKNVLSFTPASYIQYGSKYPICGIAQTPENYGAKRMTSQVAQNVFICGNSIFAGGLWGAVAGAWQGFCTFYRKRYGIEIGNRDILYKPGLKNLP